MFQPLGWANVWKVTFAKCCPESATCGPERQKSKVLAGARGAAGLPVSSHWGAPMAGFVSRGCLFPAIGLGHRLESNIR